MFEENYPHGPLEASLVARSDRDDVVFLEYVNYLDVSSRVLRIPFESLDFSTSSLLVKPSIEAPLTLDHKSLPSHLSPNLEP
ncbi:Uncharacterized protein TCM_024230 [Theobroma cacao]|uniref:Uncharacterized protein n=1 Tax=Theobroma cacao TaxID=3641 RepID=A0A061F334_THECC|nr:Uncharacterized protein TCM_024230 [Theobroma cacao]